MKSTAIRLDGDLQRIRNHYSWFSAVEDLPVERVWSATYAWTVERRRPKHLVLILAREFASNLATPTLIADTEGRLVFYNEAAEEIVGRPFSEVGEMPVDEWTARFEPRTRETEPLPPERRPVRIALNERRAAHTSFVITSADGVEREIAVTAFPLFAHADEFVGIVGIFWREMS